MCLASSTILVLVSYAGTLETNRLVLIVCQVALSAHIYHTWIPLPIRIYVQPASPSLLSALLPANTSSPLPAPIRN